RPAPLSRFARPAPTLVAAPPTSPHPGSAARPRRSSPGASSTRGASAVFRDPPKVLEALGDQRALPEAEKPLVQALLGLLLDQDVPGLLAELGQHLGSQLLALLQLEEVIGVVRLDGLRHRARLEGDDRVLEDRRQLAARQPAQVA